MKGLPLFEEQKPAPKALTVSELTARIKGVIEPAFPQVWVQGEVSNYRPSPSGHMYFSLKDEGSTIPAAVFSRGRKAPFNLKDGLQVLCKGSISVYQPQGRYQFIIDQIQHSSRGNVHTFAVGPIVPCLGPIKVNLCMCPITEKFVL